MVKVATRPAENPVGIVARKLNLSGIVREPPKLNLPGKLVFPSMHNSGHFSMLGLGDIVMPGLLLCFVLRYDSYKKSQSTSAEAGVPPPRNMLSSKLTYFHCSLLGWVACSWALKGLKKANLVSVTSWGCWLPPLVRKCLSRLSRRFYISFRSLSSRCWRWRIWKVISGVCGPNRSLGKRTCQSSLKFRNRESIKLCK